MSTIHIPSYAKLNLALKILGRRPDGFHDLETLFQRIDLHDDLTFSLLKGGKIRISCSHPAVPCDERNLVHKVARLLQDACGVKAGVRIHIHKRIPVAAGLAGGSSNAAAAFMGLNALWKIGLDRKELVAHAKKIGSDIPFFLYDCPWALGTERGDRIRPLDLKARLWQVVVVPKVPMLTRRVYGTYAARFSRRARKPKGGRDFGLTNLNDDVTILIRSLRKIDITGAGQGLFNDLEPSILALRPSLIRLKQRLLKGCARGVSFSGSGPSIFALTETREDAKRLRTQLVRSYRQVFVVRTR